jgi:hypothetical protein
MAVTYTWDITDIKKAQQVDGLTDVIVHIRWKKIGTDEKGTIGEFVGATPLTASSGSFTPYEELTKEQVLGWIQSIVVGPYEQHVTDQIQKQIIKKNDPWLIVQTAPWGETLGGNSSNVTPAV